MFSVWCGVVKGLSARARPGQVIGKHCFTCLDKNNDSISLHPPHYDFLLILGWNHFHFCPDPSFQYFFAKTRTFQKIGVRPLPWPGQVSPGQVIGKHCFTYLDKKHDSISLHPPHYDFWLILGWNHFHFCPAPFFSRFFSKNAYFSKSWRSPIPLARPGQARSSESIVLHVWTKNMIPLVCTLHTTIFGCLNPIPKS